MLLRALQVDAHTWRTWMTILAHLARPAPLANSSTCVDNASSRSGWRLWLQREPPEAIAHLCREAEALGVPCSRLIFTDQVPFHLHIQVSHPLLFLAEYSCHALLSCTTSTCSLGTLSPLFLMRTPHMTRRPTRPTRRHRSSHDAHLRSTPSATIRMAQQPTSCGRRSLSSPRRARPWRPASLLGLRFPLWGLPCCI